MSEMLLKKLETPNLSDLEINFQSDLPKSVLVQTCIKLDQSGNFPGRFEYFINCEDNERSCNSVYITDHSRKDALCFILYNKVEVPADKVIQHLEELIDWDKWTFIKAIPKSIFEPLKDKIREQKVHLSLESHCHLFAYYNGDFFSLPHLEEFEAKPLTRENLEEVVENWEHYSEGSEVWIANQIDAEMSCGAFSRKTGNLASWITTYGYGGMGLLFTKPEVRRKGLADLCTKALSNAVMRSFQINPTVFIEEKNQVSRKFFNRLGFTQVDWSGVLAFKPLAEKE